MTHALASKASTHAGLSALFDLSLVFGSALGSALAVLSIGFSSERGFLAVSTEVLAGSTAGLTGSFNGSFTTSLTGSLDGLLGSGFVFAGSFSGLAVADLTDSVGAGIG